MIRFVDLPTRGAEVKKMLQECQSCCFSGHRKIPKGQEDALRVRLLSVIYELCSSQKYTTFYTGGALGWDTLAARAVIEVRKELPDVRLILVLPCKDQAKRWKAADREVYDSLKASADEVACLAEHYYRGCMFLRNRYLVDHSSVCVCYQTKDSGGTAYTVKYARKKGLKVINLAPTDRESLCGNLQNSY